MLVEFSVENFLSIKERVTFSMLASIDKKHPHHYFKCASLPAGSKNLLKVAIIYGANASGKTNLLKALSFLEFLVLRSHLFQKGDLIPTFPFKLDEVYLSKPSTFEIVFIHKGIRYCYGVTVSTSKVIEEYLYKWTSQKKSVIFERKNTTKFKVPNNADKKERVKQEIIEEQTLENATFISHATRFNHEEISPAFEWFRYTLRTIIDHGFSNPTSMYETNKKEILTHLYQADFSIVDYAFEKREIKPEHSEVYEFIRDISDKNYFLAETKESNYIVEPKIFHAGKDLEGNKKNIGFDLDEESSGTEKFFSLIGRINSVLKNGYFLAVDELDLKLHPLLSKYIIELFLSPQTNPRNAQLIFNTHNTEFLELDLFRRDQIWFADKNRESGSTELFSLVEFKGIRNDLKNIKQRYLQGAYGAIPLVSTGHVE